MNKTRSVLKVETDLTSGCSETEISGTPSKILFNLIAISSQVCEELSIPPERLAIILPSAIRDYKNKMLKGKVTVDYNPFRNGGTMT